MPHSPHLTDTGPDRLGPRTQGTLLLTWTARPPVRLVPRRRGPWRRAVTRVLSLALDRRIAAGQPPETHPLLAARAEHLVSPAARRELARQWENLVTQAVRSPVPRSPRTPLRRGHIVAVEGEIHTLCEALAQTAPVPAQGVAAAGLLLGDGTGPLFNTRAPADLRDELRKVTRQLDPASPLAGAA